MENEKKYNVRNIVLTILCRILEEKVPSHIAIAEGLDKYSDMAKEDRAFVKLLCMGTVERVITLDDVIDEYSKTPTNKQKPVIRNILRMGVYQILFMNVPDSAACNEAVKLAKKRGFTGLSGFVNGILRNVVTHKDEISVRFGERADISENEQNAESAEKLYSEKYSLPEWIIKRYICRFGRDKALRAFEYFLKKSTTQIRCNISKISPEKLKDLLEENNISVVNLNSDGKYSQEIVHASQKCMTISGYDNLSSIQAFKDGLFTIQDFSSVMAGEILDKKMLEEYVSETYCSSLWSRQEAEHYPALEIIDICAAPGGKTLNMADRLKAEGFKAHFTACDVSEYKLNKIRENVERCGFDNIDPVISDGTVFNPHFENKFDIMIADVPCSGLGVIGRKPDIKLNASPEGIKNLVILQRNILDNAARYLKKNGLMIYSTCTIGTDENEDNVGYLEQKGFKCLEMKQICPGEYDSDGFFYALMKKISD